MPGGGGDAPPPPTGGEFLLQLLQRPHQPKTPPQQPAPSPAATRASPPTPPPQSVSLDPAVAAVGPTIPSFPFNGRDLSPPWPHPGSPPYPPNFFLHGFPQNPWPPPGFSHSQSPQFPGNRQFFGDDLRKLGPSGMNARGNSVNQQEHKLMVGSMPCEIRNNEGLLNGKCFDNSGPGTDRDDFLSKLDVPMDRQMGLGNKSFNGLHWNGQLNPRVNSHAFQQGNSNNNFHEQERGDARWGRQQHGGFNRPAPSSEMRWPPPGFPSKPKGVGNWDYTNRRGLEHNIDKKKDKYGELNHRGSTSNHEDEKVRRLSHEDSETRGGVLAEFGFSGQLDCPGPPTGSHLHSFSASDIEESLLDLSGGIVEDGNKPGYLRQDKMRGDGGRVHGQGRRELDNSGEQLMGSLVLEDGSDDKNGPRQRHNSRDKDSRSDTRGQQLLGQRMRSFKRLVECRSDIDRLNAPFLAIYGSLIPAEEEKEKQKQLLTLLEKLVSKEWPEAQLYLYGSCANSFGVSKSDIDVCLAIEDVDMNKSEILLKLADILQSDNLQNVQALTRARVPIVKLMDPSTGISCDICINNVLAVVNTKLLRDYAQIDVRLQQLAFIVKHWAKSRGVNETYHGTLSSYAYVIMCIHFLQQRRPAILPCLQGMETTYAVTIDDIECAYFDQVETLRDFGSHNKESIAQLVWAFFDYWAYRHDYANSVISVRTGSIISKRAKDWTRRIGNDRHLICIEDPFEISHDLGRVVDKHSIKVLREEFERAANIMQYDTNPCVVLFEPYVPS